jgi:hypothetical protein
MAANPDPKFAPDCFWNQRLQVTPVNSDSANFVNQFLAQLAPTNNDGNVGINTCDWTAPVYIASPGDPRIAVTVVPCGVPDDVYDILVQQFLSVAIPTYAQPSCGDDAQMAVYDPSSDTLWEFYQAVNTNGAWRIGAGGQIVTVLQNKNGYFLPAPLGATASGLSLVGGQITGEELQAGVIGHVMGIALPTCAAGVISWPAQHTDGTGLPTAIPQGLRFRLPAGYSLSNLNLTPVGMMVAQAAIDYGFVVWDTAGTISLRCKNPLSYILPPGGGVNPYPEFFQPADQLTVNQWNVLAGFPWKDVVFLQKDYGQP